MAGGDGLASAQWTRSGAPRAHRRGARLEPNHDEHDTPCRSVPVNCVTTHSCVPSRNRSAVSCPA
jgi:hypothetical protein